EEIEAGYQRVLSEFSEERFDAVADERIVSLIESIHSRAAELYELLGGKAGRDKVRKGLVGSSQLIMATDLMNKQADMAVYKGQFNHARVCYLRVLELAISGPECADQRRNATAQLKKEPIANARSSSGVVRLADVIDAVDRLLSDG
ncbi:MAG: hypothetical protein VX498_11800, partial [Myxococcota bacterium]|nr:hypothetical protein [Myxococcota bacterium]